MATYLELTQTRQMDEERNQLVSWTEENGKHQETINDEERNE